MIKDNCQTEQGENQFSIFNTFLWMLFLTFGIQMLLGFIAAVGFGALDMSGNDLFMRPGTIAITGVIAVILSFPLIKKAALQSGKSFPFKFLGFQSINIITLVKVLVAGIAYYLFESLAGSVLSIDTPQFMFDVKSQTHSILDVMLLVLGICIVAPIAEEVIFRGLAYGRLVKSRAGVTGAIIITSLVFTAIHVQYDFEVLAILSVFAFLLGYVRYKTGNLVYCIALHMQLNAFSTIELFLFL
jgi:membrane protease YdiL (CAAX protease family)